MPSLELYSQKSHSITRGIVPIVRLIFSCCIVENDSHCHPLGMRMIINCTLPLIAIDSQLH